MKSAVLHAIGDLRYEDKPTPDPGYGEVLIKIKASGGNGSYNYDWSHSEKSDSIFNNISSGNYNVTSYDKLGCKASIPNKFYNLKRAWPSY